MEANLVLTAKKWELASQLERTKTFGGVQFVKNVPERTYLAITSRQWAVLQRFAEPRTVPQVLELAIEERFCPVLGEFYELILKAVRARILVEPSQTVAPFPAANWSLKLKPARWHAVLWVLFVAGFGLAFGLQPALPLHWLDALIGVGFWLGALAVGWVVAASLLRGAGAEVYRRGWRINIDDARMLPPLQQRIVLLAPLSVLAIVTGILAWRRPEWGFIPLLGMLVQLRPIFGGAVNAMLRLGAGSRLSDAEHDYIFPLNRTVGKRVELLWRSLGMSATWLEIAYGMLWTLVLAVVVGGLADMPPWTMEFWRTQGPRLGIAAAGSLLLLGMIYVGLEIYVFARDRARARHETFRLWRKRWFAHKHVATDEAARQRAFLQCSTFRLLPPAVQQYLAKVSKPHRAKAWEELHAAGKPVSHVSLILSGRVGVYRPARSGRRVLVQVLTEHDLVGLHAVADPQMPNYLYRTLSPVVLLRVEWSEVESQILPRLAPIVIAGQVQKAPFLARISLCQNWHRQAVQRFAELSRLRDYADKEIILHQGFFSESFYIMLEGEAHVYAGAKRVGVIGPGSFFGEIGLLQNSNATARVLAQAGARCLCIPRKEFLRFVAHNHTVAMVLERVSSQRLGHPIFPLSPGNFRQI